MINEINKIINAIESNEVKIIRIPCDLDIDKVHVTKLGKELLAYRRIRSIANSDMNNIRWNIAVQHLTEDVIYINGLIKENKLKHPEELKEFVENCCAIMDVWDNKYREAFNAIKDFRDSYKAPKSIDEMNADELREYIKQHNIK